MKPVLIMGLVVSLLAACSNQAPPDRFPGFSQVGKDGDSAHLYAELNSVTRSAQGKVSFKLVRVIDGGYVIQDAVTDCRNSIQANDGIKYREDGTSDSKYSGDSSAVDFKLQPGLIALVKLVCDKAEEGRMIVGTFDDTKALELLYGPYKPELEAAFWQDPAPPKDMDIFGENKGFVRTLLSIDFSENGLQKHLLLTHAKPDNHDCHACAPLIGAAIFVKAGDKWRIEAHYPYLALLGASGEPPKMSWVQIGKDRFALLTEAGDMHQGVVSSFVGIDLLRFDGLKSILSFLDEGENSGDVSVAFGPAREGGIADVTITVTTEGENLPKTQTAHIYRFTNDKYEEVSQKVVPSTQSPKQANKVAPLPVVSNNLDQSVLRLLRLAGSKNDSELKEVILQIEALPKPAKGDRKGSRELNEKALQLLHSGDSTGAIAIFQQAVAADRSDQEVTNNLAYGYLQAEKFKEAEWELSNTLLLAPRRSSAWANLGYLYAKTSDIPAAVNAFQMAYRFSSNQNKTIEFLRKQQDDQDLKVREAAQLTLEAVIAQGKQ